MICNQCRSGFLCEPFLKPLVLRYRGFYKDVGSVEYLSCSNCLYVNLEAPVDNIDYDAEMEVFKREINYRLSMGEEL